MSNLSTTITQFSRSVTSDSSHGLQHARPPCPSPAPKVYSTNVHWVGDAIQPSHPVLSPSPSFFNLQCLTFFIVQLSHPYMTTGKIIALTIQAFVGKVMSLHFNILSRFVIAFLPRRKRLLISWLQSPSTVILEPKKIKVCHCFPIYLPWSDGTGCHDLSFLNVEF